MCNSDFCSVCECSSQRLNEKGVCVNCSDQWYSDEYETGPSQIPDFSDDSPDQTDELGFGESTPVETKENRVFVEVKYTSSITKTFNRVVFAFEHGLTFEAYLEAAFTVCNLQEEDHNIFVRCDEIKTSMSAGDRIFIDIAGYLGTGSAICLNQGWDIKLDPVKNQEIMNAAN